MLTLPSLRITWGSYSKPEPEEEQQIVTTVRLAMGGGAGGGEPLITKRVAIEKLQPIFGIENIDAMIEELDKETAERQAKALEHTTAEASALHGIVNDDAAGKPSGPPKGNGPGGNAPGDPAPKAKSGDRPK